MTKKYYFPSLQEISRAKMTLAKILSTTPLQENPLLSERYGANISLKREDLQVVRSYKIRGAFNKISTLNDEELKQGVVCASAGNHAQGVAFSCNRLKVHAAIYMPTTTPRQKIEQVKMFGGSYVEVALTGDTFDAANAAAVAYAKENGKTFIPPFDDPQVIAGQATVGLEIMQQSTEHIDYLFVPIGGGGLAAGIGACLHQLSPDTKIIGVEPAGAASMRSAFDKGEVVELENIDKFVDGAAVRKVGSYTYPICRDVLDDVISVPEGAVCTTILDLYNRNAIVVEPAGALSITALRFYADKIKGKNVVCVVSGSNNDITRTEEIREKSLLYEGLMHYFIIRFPQRPVALLSFIRDVLGPNDDIVYFSYTKKIHKEKGPAVIGIELAEPGDYDILIKRMEEQGICYEYLNSQQDLFEFIV